MVLCIISIPLKIMFLQITLFVLHARPDFDAVDRQYSDCFNDSVAQYTSRTNCLMGPTFKIWNDFVKLHLQYPPSLPQLKTTTTRNIPLRKCPKVIESQVGQTWFHNGQGLAIAHKNAFPKETRPLSFANAQGHSFQIASKFDIISRISF